VCLSACATQQSRPDLINRAMATANLYCPQAPLRQREACATAVFNHDYPAWKRDINGDLIGDALTALGSITNQEADGTLGPADGSQRFNEYVNSLVQIADSRNAALGVRQQDQAAFFAALGQVGAALLETAQPATTTICNTMVTPNGRVATTTCTP
jgi:hypothetical protein